MSPPPAFGHYYPSGALLLADAVPQQVDFLQDRPPAVVLPDSCGGRQRSENQSNHAVWIIRTPIHELHLLKTA